MLTYLFFSLFSSLEAASHDAWIGHTGRACTDTEADEKICFSNIILSCFLSLLIVSLMTIVFIYSIFVPSHETIFAFPLVPEKYLEEAFLSFRSVSLLFKTDQKCLPYST